MELTPELLERAYSAGVFPMPDRRGIIRWYQPRPRAILPLDAFHISHSLRRKLRRTVCLGPGDMTRFSAWGHDPISAGCGRDLGIGPEASGVSPAPLFAVTYDQAFTEVMRGCAGRKPTWINAAFIRGYSAMHGLGKAHSVEVWREGRLAGGTYGVHLGGAFFAESMFHTVTDASKVALARLVERLKERGFALLEVQYLTSHLARFGVVEIPHEEYMGRLEAALKLKCEF